MCKKLIYFIPFVLLLIMGSSVRAETFSLGATNDAHIGKDATMGLNDNANELELQIHDVENSRRVTVISYDISELQGGGKFIANASFSNFGQGAGAVNVYGIIEDLDDNIDETTLTWNTTPGVFKSSRNPGIGDPVALVMTDLTDVLLTFTAPEQGVRESTGSSQALDDFLNSDTDGIVAFLLASAEEGTQATIASKEHESGGMLLEGDVITPKGIDIIWVSFHGADDAPAGGAADAGFTEAPDKGYTDLLMADGYNVTRYITTGSPEPEVLNAADLVIISRSVASDGYQNDGATAWNSISAPMIIMQGWALRSSRMGYTTGTTMEDITGDVTLTASDPTHPIFAGIPLTDGTMDNPFTGIVVYPTDGTTVARGTSINTDPVNPDGTVLATISEAGNGPVGGMVIGEWPAGAVLTHTGGAETDTLAGHRLVFLTGARETDGISSETAGIFDLYPDGAQMLLNAVAYMTGVAEPEPVDPGSDGLIAYYAFENDANDSSANGLHGTLVGDPTFVEGPAGYGMALDFDGDGDYVDCGNSPLFDVTEQISIAAWVNIRSVPGEWRAVIAKGDNAWRISTNSSTQGLHFGFEDGTRGWQAANSDTVLPLNEWHHVCGTYDLQNGGRIYIDGALDGTNPDTEGITLDTYNVYIGDNSQNTGRFWDGLIDEVAIYDRALSELEVLYLAGGRATPVNPGSDGLVAYYPLENDVLDGSGNGYDGTIVGDPTFVEGAVGMALEFDGDDHVDTGYTEDLADWTISAWVMSPAAPSGDSPSGPVHREINYQFNWNHSSDTFRSAAALRVGGTWYAAKYAPVEADTWYHLTATYDGESLKAYRDGELITDNTDLSGDPDTEAATLKLGKHATAEQFFTGTVDEAMIYNRVLSTGEVRYLAGYRAMIDPGTDALIAHYPLDIDVLDASGNGNDGTINGDPNFVEGMVGMAMEFDGDGDFIDCGNAPILALTDAVSISAWIKVAVQGADHKVGGNQDGTNGGYKMSVYNDKVEFEIRTSSNSAVLNRSVAGGTVLEVDVWYHVAGVYSLADGYIRTYINGELDRELETTDALGASPGPLMIGCEPFSTGQYNFNGFMDDIRVYNEALSEAEVRYLANN